MKHTPWISLPLVTFGCFIPLSTQAQVSPDGTTTTTVNQNGNDFTIEQGDRVGDNLFHSFNEFSVPTLGSAVFNNAGDIANIFSRVTGINPSNIDGVLGANGAANLYLINPNGIIFGQNASLNLGGSFFASTADSLLFEGDTEFSAIDPQAPPLLEVSIPIGARFRDNPGDITNFSFVRNDVGEFVGLEVLLGKNLTLLGGDLNFEAGETTAKGGNIFLGGLAEAGIVTLNENGSLSFPQNLTLANITLTNDADIDVTGSGGGNITVDAQNLTLESGEFDGSSIRLGIRSESTNPEAQAGDVIINVAENIRLENSRISNQVDGIGNSGNVVINTGSLELTNGGLITSATFGQGNAGAVDITTTGDITADGENSNNFPSGITSLVLPNAEGNSGGVTISTINLNLTNGGRVIADTFSRGDAGKVDITATGDITADGENSNNFPSGITSLVDTDAEGDSGGINISTTNLNLTNGGRIDASTFGQGNAGAVDITATGDITADGENSEGRPSRIISLAFTDAEKDAGGITIFTLNLNLTNGGQVIADTFSRGDAGKVDITATGDITADGKNSLDILSSISSSVNTDAEGDSGGINISTTNLNLTNGGQVIADTSGQGDSGGINISTTNLNLTNGGSVLASTDGRGNSGMINIDAENSVFLDGINPSDPQIESSITSSVGEQGEGDAGEIKISTNSLSLTNGALINAGIFGKGRDGEKAQGGEIIINAAQSVFIDSSDDSLPRSKITSEIGQNAFGNGGNIEVNTSNLSLTNNGQIIGSTSGTGDSGNITVNATESVVLEDGNIFNRVENDGVGSGGKIEINTANLSVIDGGQITVSTLGQGAAGAVDIKASESVNIRGKSESTIINGTSARSSVRSTVQTNAEGEGGNIIITTSNLSISDDGVIAAGTLGKENAGNIVINASESVSINGSNNSIETDSSGIINSSEEGAVGNSGGIDITTTNFSLTNTGQIDVSSFGDGNGGDVSVQADTATLNNGIISATNTPAQAVFDGVTRTGGNVNFTIAEDIVLENNSRISARASENANGGNVTINADDGFILAFPNQNNDVIANASEGRGGAISIDTQAIFGLEERPDNPITNDIDASSGVDGLDGTVDINNPAVDPTTGLINLPASVGDASDQISQNPCQQGVGSEFIVTGKGGLPPNPSETLNSNEVKVGLVEPLSGRGEKETGRRGEDAVQTNQVHSENSISEAVPAMGWVFNDRGEVTLTAYKTINTEIKRSSQKVSNSCSQLRSH